MGEGPWRVRVLQAGARPRQAGEQTRFFPIYEGASALDMPVSQCVLLWLPIGRIPTGGGGGDAREVGRGTARGLVRAEVSRRPGRDSRPQVEECVGLEGPDAPKGGYLWLPFVVPSGTGP